MTGYASGTVRRLRHTMWLRQATTEIFWKNYRTRVQSIIWIWDAICPHGIFTKINTAVLATIITGQIQKGIQITTSFILIRSKKSVRPKNQTENINTGIITRTGDPTALLSGGWTAPRAAHQTGRRLTGKVF